MNKLKFVLILILLIALSRAQQSPNFYGLIDDTGFRYYPEDNMIPKDFWGDPVMTLRTAFYPCRDPNDSELCPKRYDTRNGMIVYPNNFVNILLNFSSSIKNLLVTLKIVNLFTWPTTDRFTRRLISKMCRPTHTSTLATRIGLATTLIYPTDLSSTSRTLLSTRCRMMLLSTCG